jgi:hypothetical protein
MEYSDVFRWFIEARDYASHKNANFPTDPRCCSGLKDEYSRDELFEALLPYYPLLKRSDIVEAPFLTYTQDRVKVDKDYEYSQHDIGIIEEFPQEVFSIGYEVPTGKMTLENFSGVEPLMGKEKMLDWVFHRIFEMKENGIKYWTNPDSQLLYLRFDGKTEYFARVKVLDQRTPRCLPKTKSRGLWIYDYKSGPTYKRYGETKFWYDWD